MKETRNASRLALNGLSRIRFLCLAATLAMSGLVGSHAYSALPPRIQAPRKRRGMWLWVATDDTHSSKNSVALPEQRPHHHHHKKHHKGKKHDKLMARAIALNKELICCESSQDILSLLAQQPHALTKMAGGGALNSVNFSTALHRMARYSPQDRSQTLRDARFALFLCSLAEAMAGMDYTQSLLGMAETNLKERSSHSIHANVPTLLGPLPSCDWHLRSVHFPSPLTEDPRRPWWKSL